MDVVKDKTARKILPYIKSIENGSIRGPISLHLLITDYCVNKCNMCDHWKTCDKKSLSLDVIKRIWDDMNCNDGESICLTGGDPIIHPQFDEILDLERNFDLGIICTGNFKKNFDFNKLQKLRWVRFSIDSLDPDRYRLIRGLDNLHSTILPNLRKAQEHNKEVGINFTIQRLNSPDVKNMIRFAVNNSVYRLMVYPMHGDEDLCMTDEETLNVIEQLSDCMAVGYHKVIPENNIEFLRESLISAYEKKTDVRKAVFDYTKYPCIIHKIHLAIGSDGNVFPCEMCADDTDAYGIRKIWTNGIEINDIGNVNEESIIDIWKRNFNNTFRCEKCTNCFSRYLPINQTYHENKGKRVFI